MSFIYSQALVEEYSRANCSVTDASALSSGSHTHKPCLWHDKTMEPSQLSQFGLMCNPLTDDHGTALLTWWLEAFHAKTSVSRGGGAGIDGERSGMWHHMARIIGEVRPKLAWIENSPALVTRGLDRVLCDLASIGFDARWGIMGASDVGGPHRRERIWIAAYPSQGRLEGWDNFSAYKNWKTTSGSIQALVQGSPWPDVSDPRAFGSSDGLANRTHRLKAIGNGQVPLCAATAWKLLTTHLHGEIA